MKAKLVLIIVLTMVIPALSSGQTNSGAESALANPTATPGSHVPDPPPPDASAAPEHVLQEYEAAMAGITQTFAGQLAGITEAVEQGKMSSEEAKNASSEEYLLAQMQLQLLSVWRQMDEKDLAKVAAPEDKSESSLIDDGDIVLAEQPFSSFQLTPALAERLSLTQSQKDAIRRVMTRERYQMEPLLEQLQTLRKKLLALDPEHSNKKEIKTLADAQATLLARFIVQNARMQSEIYKRLTPEQRKKLHDLEITGIKG
jgi:hypothetical protein